MERTVYSSIPMRTWRWLGVNEAYLPEGVSPEVQADADIKIEVPAGENRECLVVYRKEGHGRITATVGEGGTLNLIKAQLLPVDAPHVDEVDVKVAKDAKVHYTAVETGSSETVTKLDIDLEGDRSEADVAAIYLGDGDRKIDINYVIRHLGQNTGADMQVRGALKDRSEKIFRGTLDFVHGSHGSVGREKEEVTLLNEGIRNRSVPLLLSGEDDVDGEHAVSVGRMDQDKLFYLMSRGLDLSEAQILVVEAAFNPVLERIGDEALRAEIDTQIKERIADERK